MNTTINTPYLYIPSAAKNTTCPGEKIDKDSGREGSELNLDLALGDTTSAAERKQRRAHPEERGAGTSSEESAKTDHSSKVSASDDAPLETNRGEKRRSGRENLREPLRVGDDENDVHTSNAHRTTADDGGRSPADLAGRGDGDRVGTAVWGFSPAYEVDVGDGAREPRSDRCPSRGRSMGEEARGGGAAGRFSRPRRQVCGGI